MQDIFTGKGQHGFEVKQYFSRNFENSKLFTDIKGVVPIIHWGQHLSEIVQSLTVFKIYEFSISANLSWRPNFRIVIIFQGVLEE